MDPNAGGPLNLHPNAVVVPQPDDIFSWRNHRVLQRVPRVQRGCSCYGWAGCETVEGCMQRVYNHLPDGANHPHLRPIRLSIQNCLDCCRCLGSPHRGGYVKDVYWLMRRVGVASYTDYPLNDAHEPIQSMCGQCTRNIRPKVRIEGFDDLTGYTEAQLMFALRNRGPIAVGLTVGKEFTHYENGVLSEGVYHESERNGADIYPHYLVLMGYGITPAGERYWEFRNSMGTRWGEGGYLKLNRNFTGMFEDVWIPRGGYRV